MKLFKTLLESHRFFVTQSPRYIVRWTWRLRLYYPVAYCRFMWLELRDELLARKEES